MKLLVRNTVRLEVSFSDWDGGTLTMDPELVKLNILDSKFNRLEEKVLGEPNRLAKGKYFCFYMPTKTGTFYFEWEADIDGLPSVERIEFEVVKSLTRR